MTDQARSADAPLPDNDDIELFEITSRAAKRRVPAQLMIGAAIVSMIVGIGVVSIFWTPYDLNAVDVPNQFIPPGSDGYLLGTDKLGRDMTSQIMAGARNSLLVSMVSTVGSLIPGVLIGLLAAGASPFWLRFISRLTDIGIALPGILVALVLGTSLGPGNPTAIIAIMFWFIPTVARVTMGPARQILSRDFVEAAQAYGRPRRFILFRHVLPNIGPLIIVQASVMFALAILIEAALSYLGIGAQRPTPSWGRLLKEAQPLIDKAPYLMIIPGVTIMVAVIGFNLLGDGLRSFLDPQQTAKGSR
ncbi:ABC transporter permease [Ilumatobacter sp.]|uniref:ABC transporter permease n=1 Tax=Ilumatobacter sp. TaxID=1967498 RepID=UPI003753BCF4